MSSIILLFLCLIIGILLKKAPNFPKNTATVLNQFILFISLPAMALYYLPEIKLSFDLIYPISLAWIAFSLAYVFFNVIGKRLGWSRKLIGCLILTAGLGNTSFVGIPVIQALYGEEGIKTLILIDLPGTFVVLTTLGLIVATRYSKSGGITAMQMTRKIIQFPPFIAFLIGMLFMSLDWHFPPMFQDVLGRLAATISPIALVSVGYQLTIQPKSKHWNFLILGLAFQLLLIPAVMFLIFHYVYHQDPFIVKVSVIEAAMAPMITAAIIASSYGLKPKLSAMMVGIGIPVSFITMAIWYYFLEYFFR